MTVYRRDIGDTTRDRFVIRNGAGHEDACPPAGAEPAAMAPHSPLILLARQPRLRALPSFSRRNSSSLLWRQPGLLLGLDREPVIAGHESFANV